MFVSVVLSSSAFVLPAFFSNSFYISLSNFSVSAANFFMLTSSFVSAC